jgi:hypothetical protein
MTLEQFLSLTELEKVGGLNNQGVILAERRICANRIYLYAINYFYMELVHDFSGLHGNELYIHRVFEDKRCLDYYLPAKDAGTQQL